MTYTIAQSTICTECTEMRARAVATMLREQGFDVQYGRTTNIPRGNAAFSRAFGDAVNRTSGGIPTRFRQKDAR